MSMPLLEMEKRKHTILGDGSNYGVSPSNSQIFVHPVVALSRAWGSS